MSDLIKRLDNARSSYSMSQLRGSAAEAANEITTLRQQLADAKEENERVRQANIHTMDVFEDMKAAKEQAEARVAELESVVSGYSRDNKELQRILNRRATPYPPFILREQAEALEEMAAKVEEALGHATPESIREGLLAYAKEYRAQADELEQQEGQGDE